jgi:hypothetical protein
MLPRINAGRVVAVFEREVDGLPFLLLAQTSSRYAQ